MTCLRIPATGSARVFANLTPRRPRAQGKPDAYCAPAASCAKIGSTRASPLQVRRSLRLSLRSGFNGFLRTLPGDRAFCLRRLHGLHPAGLTSASRRQDHTTSPSARSASVLCAARVHRTLTNVRDDRETPLASEQGDAALLPFLPVRKAENFPKEGWTRRANQCRGAVGWAKRSRPR
jgi:hypothetical protein